PRHRTDRVENHQATSHRDGAAIKAEPATSFSTSESPADKRRGFPLPSLNLRSGLCYGDLVQNIP
ncbi:hypothetical protein DU055_13045, partial [Salmonella enterica subsp. enterica serovar Hofit]|nr:hypothetical protein [Salmonella enterica subsp. enterica serovar Hofit]